MGGRLSSEARGLVRPLVVAAPRGQDSNAREVTLNIVSTCTFPIPSSCHLLSHLLLTLTPLGLKAKDGLSQHSGSWECPTLGWMTSYRPCSYAPSWARSPHSSSLSPLLEPKMTHGWPPPHSVVIARSTSQWTTSVHFQGSKELVHMKLCPGPHGRQNNGPQSCPHPNYWNLWTRYLISHKGLCICG